MELLLVLLWMTLGGFAPTPCVANPDAKRLYDDLLSNYNRLIRPVGNNSDRLTVKMGLRLSQLIDVVSKFVAILIVHRLPSVAIKEIAVWHFQKTKTVWNTILKQTVITPPH